MRPVNPLHQPLIFAALLACSLVAAKDTSPPAAKTSTCISEEFRQFDFWLGKWQVTERGQPAGRNEIQPDLGGCALFESWTSVDNTRGRSVSFYDRRRQRWHQTWIDNRGGSLQLDGRIVAGSMVLEDQTDGASGKGTVNRITWTPNADGSVRQHWEVKKGQEAAWETVFDGLYLRAEEVRIPGR
jgi:hypothetical protein